MTDDLTDVVPDMDDTATTLRPAEAAGVLDIPLAELEGLIRAGEIPVTHYWTRRTVIPIEAVLERLQMVGAPAGPRFPDWVADALRDASPLLTLDEVASILALSIADVGDLTRSGELHTVHLCACEGAHCDRIRVPRLCMTAWLSARPYRCPPEARASHDPEGSST